MIDHDQLFKDLLTTFFAEFLELFLPKMAAELDRTSIEFLGKELSTDLVTGGRHEGDLLAKVRLRGREAFVRVHVENQATAEAGFPKRMFRYFAILHRKFDLPIFPIAIFSYDRPQIAAADTFELELFGLSVLRFQFHGIQLNRLNWRDFLSQPNPVANALMTKMKIDLADRPRVKLECLRMLVTLKLDPARSSLINAFMKSYLALTASERLVYDRELKLRHPLEKEIDMQRYVTEWEEEGIAKGIAKGRVAERLELVQRFLKRALGQASDQVIDRINRLSADQLSDLADAMYDFKTVEDLKVWLAEIDRI